MAGHSKWKNIKHKKGKEDAKKGKIFTKLAKEIAVCAKQGGGDPSHNAKLRICLEKAREENMPKEIITRAIKKGSGTDSESCNYEKVFYEGYGPERVAVIVEALTDNRNRTNSDLKHAFLKGGGHMGEIGNVSWMFDEFGRIEIDGQGLTEDAVLEKLIDSEVEKIEQNESKFELFCNPKNLDTMKKEVEKQGFVITQMAMVWVAKESIEINDEAHEKIANFVEVLEDLDDVQHVYLNV